MKPLIGLGATILSVAVLIVANVPAPSAAQSAPAAPPAFAACRACHTVVKGQRSGLGPNLNGVVGRPAASLPGFNYSAALKNSRLSWNEKALNDFLAAPAKKVPGTRMAIGMADPAKRAAIIDYLKTQK